MDLILSSLPILLPLCLALGLITGFLAGLLGVGGGMILVPGLYYMFRVLDYAPDIMMHMAVATSLALIVPTGLSSARAHGKKGALRFDLIKRLGPWIVAGVVFGLWLAAQLETEGLMLFFASALVVLAGLMILIPTVPAHHDDGRGPGKIPSVFGGVFIGAISSLMGIGGATLSVPFLSFYGIKIHQAVATAAAIGPMIAIPGAIGFIILGMAAPTLPPFSFGYLCLPAILMIAPISMLTAPFGARAAHALPVKTLKGIFAALIVLIALHMMYEALHVH